MITQKTEELDILWQLFLRKQFHFLLDFFIYPIITGNKDADNDFIYGIGVERSVLNFVDGTKPGDFDLIIIPLKDKKPLINYVGVLEAKVSRPRLNKLSKHPNFSGKEQISGLIRDDFPFVGLLHIIVPEKDNTTAYLNKFPDGSEINGVDIVNSIELEERQAGRIKKLQLPDDIGFSATVLYDFENYLFGGASNYKFCTQREVDLKKLETRIDFALKEFPEKFSYYSVTKFKTKK